MRTRLVGFSSVRFLRLRRQMRPFSLSLSPDEKIWRRISGGNKKKTKVTRLIVMHSYTYAYQIALAEQRKRTFSIIMSSESVQKGLNFQTFSHMQIFWQKNSCANTHTLCPAAGHKK